MATDQMVGLPSAADFTDIEVPEFPRKYVKRQGPGSTKGGKVAGRTFSASGPKADLIARIIFADMQLTRAQIATIAGCSPSRVSEVIWAMDDAKRKGIIATYPAVPTKPPVTEDVTEDTDENAEPSDDDVLEQREPAELADEIADLLSDDELGEE
jgi:hypothetical protein